MAPRSVDVRGGPDFARLSLRLLGRHVARRAHDDAAFGLTGAGKHLLGKAKVGDFGGAEAQVGRMQVHVQGQTPERGGAIFKGHQKDVPGLQVAMYDPVQVDGVNGAGKGQDELSRSTDRLRPASQPLGKRAALHEFHREVGRAVLDIHIVDLHDVGMLQ